MKAAPGQLAWLAPKTRPRCSDCQTEVLTTSIEHLHTLQHRAAVAPRIIRRSRLSHMVREGAKPSWMYHSTDPWAAEY